MSGQIQIHAESKEDDVNHGFDLTIRAMPTDKSKIKVRTLMRNKTIPSHPKSVIFSGSSGSGKSTLLVNLLTRKEFYKNYFDEIHLFSPTGKTDDMFTHLDKHIKDDNVHTEMKIKDLDKILEEQEKQIISKGGIHKAKKVLLIFEDVQSNRKFMNSKSFLKSFIMNRHYGVSTWLCGQAWNRTPRACRLQASAIFYFEGSESETDRLASEYTPPGMNVKDFKQMIIEAVEEKHSFLFINKDCSFEDRYRKRLDEIIDWRSNVRDQ